MQLASMKLGEPTGDARCHQQADPQQLDMSAVALINLCPAVFDG